MTVTLVLKLAALLLSTLGAGLALFGDAHKDGQLTRVGRIALLILMVGLGSSAALEWMQELERRREKTQQAAEAKRQEEETTFRRLTDGRWDAALRQPIVSIDAVVYIRQTTTLSAFEEALRTVNFTFVTHSSASDETIRRSLTFGVIRGKEDAQKRIRLTPRVPDECVRYGPPVTLLRNLKLPRRNSTSTTASGPEYVVFGVPDGGSSTRFLMTGRAMTVDGWNYATTPRLSWTPRDAAVCGIEASLPWRNTYLLPDIVTLADLAKISHLSVQLPRRWRTVKIDVLELRLRTASDTHTVNLRELSFTEHDNKLAMFARMSGYQVLESCKANLEEDVKDEQRRATRRAEVKLDQGSELRSAPSHVQS